MPMAVKCDRCHKRTKHLVYVRKKTKIMWVCNKCGLVLRKDNNF